ncbi:arsenic resistance N-acetyltransferase ArsN2 [Pseudomonas sp. TWP3-2]|uniref:arsenic resistance N-acetyltransferase ArsN2 n=1 Tax=Pseudomonas sp. TWP3-2 TaxID=2804574 RepID=UPI003CEE64C7
MGSDMTIQANKIAGAQWQRFRAALESANLPADDIDLPGRTFFEFAIDGETVGWGGFETHGADGLLRSLMVVPAHRSKGVGVAVLRVIESIAAEQGIARLHLLTTTASGFFEHQGYAVSQRDTAPPMIFRTGQFMGLCPGSACYMRKALPSKGEPTALANNLPD